MAEVMEGALQMLLSGLTRPLAHVVHIGAGTGGDLALYQAAGAKAVTLIEGDAGAAERLEGLATPHKGVTVICAVVSGDTRRRAFRQMNFPDLSSLRVPVGLKELFPGLRVLSKELVSPVNPARLIAPLELSDTGANLLVIEAPGEALGILRALEPDDLLQRFDAIHLQEARVPLYDKAPPADDIRAYLLGAGFSAVFETSPDDPERPCLSARLDRVALQSKRAHDALGKTLKQAQMRNKELTGRLAAVQKATGAQIAALRGELKEAGRQIAQHTDKVGGLNDALARTREDAARQMAALQDELTGVQAELARAQQEAAQHADQVSGLRGAREEMGQEMAALQGELTGVQDELAHAQQESAQHADQVSGLRGAREEMGQEMAALQGELTGVQAELARAQQEAAQRAEQVGGLRAAREEVALEMAALRDDLAGALAEAQAAAQVEKFKAALEVAQKDAGPDKEARAGTEHRLAQAREEMLRAEGQINLIRDLLLQGPGL